MAWAGLIVGAVAGGLVALCAAPLINKITTNETARRWSYYGVFFVALALGREFIQPTVNRYIEAAQLEETLLKESVFIALKEYEPDAYNRFIADAKSAIQNGADAASLKRQSSHMLLAVVTKRVPVASNSAALEYLKSTMREVEYLHSKGGDACYRALFPDPGSNEFLYDDMPAALKEADRQGLINVIKTARLKPGTPPTEAEFVKASEPAHPFFQKNADELEKVGDKKEGLTARRRACEITITLYNELFKLPPDDAGVAMRYLVAAGGK